MGPRQRARRAFTPSSARVAGLERELVGLERALTQVEESAQGRLPEVEAPGTDPQAGVRQGPRRGLGRDPAQGIAAVRARVVRLHARIRALEWDPGLASPSPPRPHRGKRFRRKGAADAAKPPAGARLVAAKLAEAGAPNEEVDRYLRDTFTLDERSG